MNVSPRHVICVLGQWRNFDEVRSIVADANAGFSFDEDYSILESDDRMISAFAASIDRFNPTLTDDDWRQIEQHTAVAYVLSPPVQQSEAVKISGSALLLIAELLKRGGVAAKNESSGLAHGRQEWLALADAYSAAIVGNELTSAGASLLRSCLQRIIHDDDAGVYYSVGLHLLGHRDIEISAATEPVEALRWIECMALYLAADRPDRPLLDGDGFRQEESGDRKVIRHTQCRRYEPDEFFFNPYGYFRLDDE